MEIIRKISSHIQMYGYGHTLGMMVKRLTWVFFRFTWQRMILLSQDIVSDVKQYRWDNNYEIRNVELCDFENERWKESFFNAEKQAIYKQRFLSNIDECYGVFINGELASVGWNHYNELFIYGKFHIPAEDKAVIVYDQFTLPRFRNRGLHKLLISFQKHMAAIKGYKCIYVVVATYNLPSLRNHKKEGMLEMTRFWIWVCGKHTWCSLKKLPE